ncbi:tetratricopeptide repeat protein [Geobacter sp. DSM 9736]|uniref:tetratricopeptide repeat protein n=1 Tax=Geobacter sp. DSM 9736 TaxID=1277350 RepID=UPI000B514B8E|nr:tetratricopeptide repeat protein [Geobacter sp. DSM 9736]
MRESRLGGHAPLIALSASLLFVAHPVQTEAVAYITQRLTSMATMLYLLSLVLWAKWGLLQDAARQTAVPRWVYAAVSFSVASAAMLTKEISVTLPLAGLLYSALFLSVPWRVRLLRLLPLLLGVLIPVVGWHLSGPSADSVEEMLDQARGGTAVSRWEYLVTQPRVLVTYLRLLVFPVAQNLDYDYPLYHSPLALPVFCSLVFLLSLVFLALWLVRRAKAGRIDSAFLFIPFGIGWFFLTLLVESTVIPLDDVIAEHRLYLPSAGAAMAVAVSAGLLVARVGAKVVVAGSIAAVLLLGTATWRRNEVWQSPLALWSDAAAKSPAKARPRYNLGTVLTGLGRYDEAIGEFREALKRKPEYPEAWHNLGTAFAAKGETDEAIASYRQALRLAPDLPQAHNSLGTALMQKGETEEAGGHFIQAVRSAPMYPDARNNLGAFYGMEGKTDAAIAELEEAVRLQPDNPRFRFNLSEAYEQKGWGARAAEERQKGERLRNGS